MSPAVEVIEGPQASGKTSRLLALARAAVEAGDASRLLVVCASKDSAAAFRRRLGFAVAGGHEAVEGLRVRSARALSFEVLAPPAACGLFGHGPRVLLDVERSILLSDLRLQGVGRDELTSALRELHRVWDAGELPQGQDGPAGRYCALLEEFGAYDVRELGARALHAVRALPELAQALAARTVLVDDANLIGPAQLRLAEALAGQSLVLVGDMGVANPFFDVAATGGSLARFARERGVEPERLAAPVRAGLPAADTYVVKAPDLLVEAVACAKNVRHVLDNVAVDLSQDHALVNPDGASDADGATGTGAGDAGLPAAASSFEELVYPNEVCVVIPRGAMLHDVCQKLKAAGVATVTCTEGQPVGGDPRRVASVATLQSFTLLGLAANPRDLVCWRTWVGLGRSDVSARAWGALSSYARERGLGVLDALAGLDAAAATQPFEGAELLAKRHAQAQALVSKARRRRGRQLIDLVSPNENLTFTRLCEPVVAQDAGEFFAAANLGAVDRGFGGRLWDVRVGVPEAFAGLQTKACVLLGLNEGVVPRTDPAEAARRENECRQWRGLLAKSRAWLTMSYVQGDALGHAQAAGARVRRVRSSPDGDVAMLAPSPLLRELGTAAPSTMGAQQFVACVLGDTL